MIAEQQEEAFRERRRRAAEGEDVPPPPDDGYAEPVYEPQMEAAPVEQDRIVAPVERDLLYFLLNYGTNVLNFESDSEFYVADEKPTVTDFIAGAIDSDGGSLVNAAYQKLYATYLTAYDEGQTQEEIVRAMLNSPDREVSRLTAQLSIERYELTVKSFEESLTTRDSWLVNRVPKLILMYNDKRLESRLDALRREMATPEGQNRVMELMTEMVRLQKLQKNVKDKMNK